MTLQEIAAKVTGLESSIAELKTAKETAETQTADIQAKLTAAEASLSTVTAERDTLAGEKAALTEERDGLKTQVAELEAKAETVKEAASKQAVDIVASQGAEAAADAAEVEGSTGAAGETIHEQYAKLSGADRVAFFRKHKAELIKNR